MQRNYRVDSASAYLTQRNAEKAAGLRNEVTMTKEINNHLKKV
jgi:hypothetical protein